MSLNAKLNKIQTSIEYTFCIVYLLYTSKFSTLIHVLCPNFPLTPKKNSNFGTLPIEPVAVLPPGSGAGEKVGSLPGER